MSEHCLSLLHRLGLGQAAPAAMQSFGITSSTSGEGVTTIAAQMAISAAGLLGKRTVLVDCNSTRPAVHRTFRTALAPGLRDAIGDPAAAGQFVRQSVVEHLWLLTAGDGRGDVTPAWASPNFARLLDELRGQFELVLVDLPPATREATAGIGAMLDGVLLVVEAEAVRWEVAQSTAASLAGADVNLLGVVMNKRRQYVPRWLYRTI
jgi:Mrp family chromosome partitioning ATPase